MTSSSQSRRKVGMWTTCTGQSLHDSLGDTIRWQRTKMPCPGLRWLPGTIFTDGEHMYEVVYGVQSLGDRPAGWVACVRTDWIDNGPPEGHERVCYSLFGWSGKPRDGAILGAGGSGRPFILRFVAASPRVFA